MIKTMTTTKTEPNHRQPAVRYLPEKPTDDMVRRVTERIAVHLLEVLALTSHDGRTSDPAEVARHQLVSAASSFASSTVEAMRSLGHKIDYRQTTNGDTLRYLADLCDWCDGQTGQWNDWDNEDGTPISLPCIDEKRPVPLPLLPPVKRSPGINVRLDSVPC